MREKDLNVLQEGENLSAQPRRYVEIPTFGKFFRKHGVYDGKLFYSNDKITYTFVLNREEIVSLHFDKVRRTIFYKGHSIANMQLTQAQIHHLEMFQKELQKDATAKDMFLELYLEVFGQYLSEYTTISANKS